MAEVEEQAELEAGAAQVIEKLGFVNGLECSEGFHFDHKGIVNDEIWPKLSDDNISEHHFNRHLRRGWDAFLVQPDEHGNPIHRLEMPKPQLVVHRIKHPNHAPGELSLIITSIHESISVHLRNLRPRSSGGASD